MGSSQTPSAGSTREQHNWRGYRTLSNEVKILRKLPSDHLPLLIKENGSSEPRRKIAKKKIYRFEQMWIRSEECQKIIQENWENGTEISNLDGLRRKCDQVGRALSSWNWTKFGHIQHNIRRIREDLAKAQASNLFEEDPEEEDEKNRELEEL
ncbi:hypothetical protein U1Q18_044387, partial [Sarracenia purpurea var. burkii]